MIKDTTTTAGEATTAYLQDQSVPCYATLALGPTVSAILATSKLVRAGFATASMGNTVYLTSLDKSALLPVS